MVDLERFHFLEIFVIDDSLWLMFDIDRWGEKNISEICRQARQKQYQLAISNPCFEVWLYLHFNHPDSSQIKCKDFEKKLFR